MVMEVEVTFGNKVVVVVTCKHREVEMKQMVAVGIGKCEAMGMVIEVEMMKKVVVVVTCKHMEVEMIEMVAAGNWKCKEVKGMVRVEVEVLICKCKEVEGTGASHASTTRPTRLLRFASCHVSPR